MAHRVVLDYVSGLHFEVDTLGGKISLDGDEKFGGRGKGVRPKPLMLTALGGCMGMDIASLMPKLRAEEEVQRFWIEVEGQLTDEHPKTYHTVSVDVFFEGADLKKDRLLKIVRMSRERYCGVYAMFEKFAQVQLTVHFLPEGSTERIP